MKKTGMTDSIHLASSGVLPHYWPINGLAVLAGIMAKMGIDKSALLAGSGINPGDLDNPDACVTPEQELQVLRKIPRLAKDPKIGLMIGQQYHVGVHGKFGAAALSSETSLDAVRLVFKYTYLAPSYFQYDLRTKDNLIFLRMKELTDLKDIRVFVCESEFVSVYRMCGDVLGAPLPLKEIRLAYPQPAYASAYQEVFQCPAYFSAREHMMVMDSALLFKKLPMSSPMAKKIYEKECEQLGLRLKAQETIAGQARNKIMSQGEGLPSFSRLARSMNMSPATLRRRLKDEGTSFKKLVAEILSKKAIDMIQTTSSPMEAIAAELGYSDLANFYRAFKSWTGHNPGHYRKKSG